MTGTPPHTPRPGVATRRTTREQRWLGFVALLAVGAALVLPYGLAKHRHPAPKRPEAVDQSGAVAATVAMASLASALGALGRVKAKVQAEDPPVEPPDAAEFDSPTACVRSYLPEVDVAGEPLDLLCSETDLWTIERTIAVRLAHRAGGAQYWTRLGRHSLAALAAMRRGCCVASEPLLAVVPGLWCGILRDELRSVGPAPSAEVIASYESMMKCLAARGVRLPERWNGVPEDLSQAAFEDFLHTARRRHKK
jgi:hypothetical protein